MTPSPSDERPGAGGTEAVRMERLYTRRKTAESLVFRRSGRCAARLGDLRVAGGWQEDRKIISRPDSVAGD
jgi:hypothetical protein